MYMKNVCNGKFHHEQLLVIDTYQNQKQTETKCIDTKHYN